MADSSNPEKKEVISPQGIVAPVPSQPAGSEVDGTAPSDQQNVTTDLMKKLLSKYQSKINKELNLPQEAQQESPAKISSQEYLEFKEAYLPKHLSIYEQLCNMSEKILKVAPPKPLEKDIKESIEICHLNITPEGATSLAYVGPLVVTLFGLFFSLFILNSLFFMLFSVTLGLTLLIVLRQMPLFLANNWRMQASNQMVLCVFYVVTYMRHTSNLELAVDFASEHLSGPLALDLKKVLWDVETEKYENVRESLDAYLETWRKWNMEFIEAFHLIESSLFESSESRRLDLLDKSLSVMLDETYEKMLHYAQNLKSPITMLHMLGVILPILGLVILPLIVSFMSSVKWYHIATIYDVIVPASVYFMGKSILSKRPSGYGDTDISKQNPELKKFRNIIINLGGAEIVMSPLIVSVLVGVTLVMLALSPLYLHSIGFPDFGFYGDPPAFKFLGYKESLKTGEEVGPFGLGASIISLFFPLGLGLGFGLWFKLRSKNVIKIREDTKKLEAEFASALFQLGNRLGDGLPAEIAFGKVAETMEGSKSGLFFQIVSNNIRRLGMSVEEAIFSPKVGALAAFPSKIIESSMKVLTESSKKGPKVAANALLNVARYIKEMHKVDERLKDLLSDIISSMKSQINFLSPVISGIVIGITSMVTSILGRLTDQMSTIQQSTDTGAATGFAGIAGLFEEGMPTFWFQIIVGIYVVQIIYILTILANGIENGADKLNERFMIGRNLIKSTVLYVVVAFFIMVSFNLIAAQIMDATLSLGG
ncbi:hypothetical protein D6764_05525 [Candidatus Woesearchaeota archaeon]|nr:MAG: hypothetical protein D6764_05525 [Candidatus Woesearchaeota archaeon]